MPHRYHSYVNTSTTKGMSLSTIKSVERTINIHFFIWQMKIAETSGIPLQSCVEANYSRKQKGSSWPSRTRYSALETTKSTFFITTLTTNTDYVKILIKPSNISLIATKCLLKENTYAGIMMCVRLPTNKYP